MTKELEKLRRRARQLNKAHALGEAEALRRVADHPPRAAGSALKHADFLHVVAQEQGFRSWPDLKIAVETRGFDRAQKQQHLKIALYHGQNAVVRRLLDDTPDLARGLLGLEIALYDRAAVERALAHDPKAATRALGPQSPMLHLAFSRHIHAVPDKRADMLAIAELLLAHGADTNDTRPVSRENDHPLSALYGAIGHANNMVLGQWLLDHGADPNDGESLYHATELGHHNGLKMLLDAGAEPRGTNALLRALDFNDHGAVALLLNAGADVEEFNDADVGGEAPWVIPALHQAARRMCDKAMVRTLLAAGADPSRRFQGVTPYAMACIYGNEPGAEAIRAAGGDTVLGADETMLVAAAKGRMTGSLDTASLAPAYQHLLHEVLRLPGDRLPHIRALIGIGFDCDAPDGQGLPPGQVAGWEGLPDMLEYFLSLGPDLSHVNSYGGTYLSTVIHGAENCPERAGRDHVGCARLLLQAGVALPRRVIEFAGEEALAAFLADWAEQHPEQVTEDGAV